MATNSESFVNHTIAPPSGDPRTNLTDGDEEIIDNFMDDPYDDGIPLGMGGKHESNSSEVIEEPEEPTPDDDIPSDDTAKADSVSEPEPVQEVASDEIVEEPEPYFPPSLLQMAGLADAKAAKAAGFQDSESLFAAMKLFGKNMLAQKEQEPISGLYRPQVKAPEPQVIEKKEPEETGPFQLPQEKMELFDEDLQEVLRNMHESYQKQDSIRQQELHTLQNQLKQREDSLVLQQEQNEEEQFDKAIQNLGDWKDEFGIGSGIDLHRTGQYDPSAMTNFNHRALLFEAVQAVREVNASQGIKQMPLEQEIQWALMQRYPDKFQQLISKNIQPKNSGQMEGAVASRPTQRKTPPKSQNDRTIAKVNEMLRKKGSSTLSKSTEEVFEGDV